MSHEHDAYHGEELASSQNPSLVTRREAIFGLLGASAGAVITLLALRPRQIENERADIPTLMSEAQNHLKLHEELVAADHIGGILIIDSLESDIARMKKAGEDQQDFLLANRDLAVQFWEIHSNANKALAIHLQERYGKNQLQKKR